MEKVEEIVKKAQRPAEQVVEQTDEVAQERVRQRTVEQGAGAHPEAPTYGETIAAVHMDWEKEVRREILSISLSTCNMILLRPALDSSCYPVRARNAVYHIISKQVEAEYCSFVMKAPSPFLAKFHRYMLRVRWSQHGEFPGYHTARFLRCVRIVS